MLNKKRTNIAVFASWSHLGRQDFQHIAELVLILLFYMCIGLHKIQQNARLYVCGLKFSTFYNDSENTVFSNITISGTHLLA